MLDGGKCCHCGPLAVLAEENKQRHCLHRTAQEVLHCLHGRATKANVKGMSTFIGNRALAPELLDRNNLCHWVSKAEGCTPRPRAGHPLPAA